nr:hypothetical protein [Promicromonospora soli]
MIFGTAYDPNGEVVNDAISRPRPAPNPTLIHAAPLRNEIAEPGARLPHPIDASDRRRSLLVDEHKGVLAAVLLQRHRPIQRRIMSSSDLSRRSLRQAAGVAALAAASPAAFTSFALVARAAALPPVRDDIGVSAFPFDLGQVRLTASRWSARDCPTRPRSRSNR